MKLSFFSAPGWRRQDVWKRAWFGLALSAYFRTFGAESANISPIRSEGMSAEVHHTPQQPRTGQTVLMTAKLAQPSTAKDVALLYQLVDPGHYIAWADAAFKSQWIQVPMHDDGQQGDALAGDGIYSVELPGTLQIHRRLVRYRLQLTDASGHSISVPDRGEKGSNDAYYVYDGVPAWKASINPKSRDSKQSEPINFSAAAMRRVQVYQLIAKDPDVKAATWYRPNNSKEYPYTGTLIADGQVYDHVGFRARGGGWRHAMGKNMWKFKFNSGQALRPKDDFGTVYPAKWSKLNLRACIQQGDYGERGEQGLFESVGFRLFNLAGTESPFTHWIQLRIVSGEAEAPSNQYEGDFWGLYLAIENEDGNFLKNHSLPDGNVYKMMFGEGQLSHQGARSVTNASDIHGLIGGFFRAQSDAWWKKGVALDRYYSYRAIIESIHHYDVVGGKNYTFYFNPETKRAQVIPWDIDLTWASQMYGDGEEPFHRPVLSRPEFQLEYQNRLREIRDLLFNSEQTGRLIDECAAVIWDSTQGAGLVEADRRKWDYHPIMASRYVDSSKAGQGKFYEASPTRDFKGMVQVMKDWVQSRTQWIDANLLTDRQIPETPKLEPLVARELGPNQWTFRCSDYRGKTPFGAQQWRVGEVEPPKLAPVHLRAPGRYEITPVWESPKATQFTNSMALPGRVLLKGHTYRVRVRVEDETGHWSHWSAPAEFVANP